MRGIYSDQFNEWCHSKRHKKKLSQSHRYRLKFQSKTALNLITSTFITTRSSMQTETPRKSIIGSAEDQICVTHYLSDSLDLFAMLYSRFTSVPHIAKTHCERSRGGRRCKIASGSRLEKARNKAITQLILQKIQLLTNFIAMSHSC